MTNITLSIDDGVYKKMKQYSEIRWSEFVRKSIEKRIEELDSIAQNEGVLTMLASESVLRKEWENQADERWNDI